jgi:predicted phosphodiesterase
VRIIFLSDTHGQQDRIQVPDGDILIHAGDLTRHGTIEELAAVNEFLERLPHPDKFVIAGNRDFCFERQPVDSRRILTGARYLQDEEAAVGNLRIFGSPWQPPFLDMAFNLPRGEPLREKWDRIPEGIDILVTHTPPMGIGDRTIIGQHVGCEELILAVQRVRPKVHVFGHIHEAYGEVRQSGVRFINASVVDIHMCLKNPPVIMDLV